jgi:hypothetical protein
MGTWVIAESTVATLLTVSAMVFVGVIGAWATFGAARRPIPFALKVLGVGSFLGILFFGDIFLGQPIVLPKVSLTVVGKDVKIVYGPKTAKLDHAEDGTVKIHNAGVRLRDFIAEARFYNPYDAREEQRAWDYGFGFRGIGTNQQYRVYVDSDGNWTLCLITYPKGQITPTIVASDKLSNLDMSADGFNQIRIIAAGDIAFLFVNGIYAATLDVSGNEVSGDIWVGTGFKNGREIAGKSTFFEDFTVWTLSSIYGPVDGNLYHNEDNWVKSHKAGVKLSDFIAEARFYNPYDALEEKRAWDYGFGFRDTGRNQQYRVYVDSDRNWTLYLFTFPNGQVKNITVASGKLSNLDVSANGSNYLLLFVEGKRAFLFVNDACVAELNVSGKITPGDIWVGIGFLNEHEISGRSTRYNKFNIWTLPISSH